MTDNTPIESLVHEGETLLWHGRTEGFPVLYWLGFAFFLVLWLSLFVFPMTYFLLTGDVIMNIILNGQPLADAPSSDVVFALLSFGVVMAVFFVLMTLFTVHRMSRRYAVTDRDLIIRENFILPKVRRLPLRSVIQHSLVARKDLITATFQYLPSRGFIQKIYGVCEFCFHDFRDPDGHFPSIISAALATADARSNPTEALS